MFRHLLDFATLTMALTGCASTAKPPPKRYSPPPTVDIADKNECSERAHRKAGQAVNAEIEKANNTSTGEAVGKGVFAALTGIYLLPDYDPAGAERVAYEAAMKSCLDAKGYALD